VGATRPAGGVAFADRNALREGLAWRTGTADLVGHEPTTTANRDVHAEGGPWVFLGPEEFLKSSDDDFEGASGGACSGRGVREGRDRIEAACFGPCRLDP
jgi:hypothetical protein